MKYIKNFYKQIAMIIVFSILTSYVLPINNVQVAQAASIKLSQTSLILNVGQSETLKMKGTKKAASWSSSDMSIVMVSSQGKVSALKEGKAEVTAQINNKKYTCKVVVLKKENSYVASAPFKAKELELGSNMSAVMPDDWKPVINSTLGEITTVAIMPTSSSTTDAFSEDKLNNSFVLVLAMKTDESAGDYSDLKEALLKEYTVEKLNESCKKKYAKDGEEVTISDLVTSDFVSTLGTAFKLDCNISFKKNTEERKIKTSYYILNIDNYLIIEEVFDLGDTTKTPALNTVAEYLLNSIQIK